MAAYRESTKALVEGGADLILIETVFDTLNAKAAVFAVKTEFEALGVELPIMISGTITDASGARSGRLLKRFTTPAPRRSADLWPELCAGARRTAPVRTGTVAYCGMLRHRPPERRAAQRLW